MTQNRRPINTEAWVQYEACQCEIYGRQLPRGRGGGGPPLDFLTLLLFSQALFITGDISQQMTTLLISSLRHSVVCLGTGPYVFSKTTSPLSAIECLRLLPPLPVPYILPSIFPSITCLEGSSYTLCDQSS
jgi:hypothetical protein